MLVIIGVFIRGGVCNRQGRDLLIQLKGRLNHSFRLFQHGESSSGGVFNVEAFIKALVKA